MNTVQLLECAADKLAAPGAWTSQEEKLNPSLGPWCAVTSLRVAQEHDLIDEAIMALAQVVYGGGWNGLEEQLYAWNDGLRDKRYVIRALRQAAKNLRKESA